MLEKVLPIMAAAIGTPLTAPAAHEIAELVDRRTFSLDEFPDVVGTFERHGDSLSIIGAPGRVDVDLCKCTIALEHPDRKAIREAKCRWALSA